MDQNNDDRLVAEYLATRDEPCPGCGYNLRGIKTSACPECGRRVSLGLTYFPGWWLAAIIGSSIASGPLTATMLVGLVAIVLEPDDALPYFGWLLIPAFIVNVTLVMLYRSRNSFVRRPRLVQQQFAIAAIVGVGLLSIIPVLILVIRSIRFS